MSRQTLADIDLTGYVPGRPESLPHTEYTRLRHVAQNTPCPVCQRRAEEMTFMHRRRGGKTVALAYCQCGNVEMVE